MADHEIAAGIGSVIEAAYQGVFGGLIKIDHDVAAEDYIELGAPYNLSMYIKDYLGMQASQWDTRILATDISQKALATAKKGIYELPDTLPESWRKRYL